VTFHSPGADRPEELAELNDLALILQAHRPVPRAEFARALDARAATGFPRPAAGASRARRGLALARLRRAPLVLGSAAAAFIVVTAIATSGLLSNGGGGVSGTRERPGADTAAGRASGAAAEQAPVPPAPSPAGIAPRAPSRKVERSASLTLAAPSDEVEGVADRVVRTTDRFGGFVLQSSVSSGESGTGATLDVRIPSARLQAALAELSRLAHVRARSQATQDVTATFGSQRRRLAEALAERRALLRLLARAATPNETASVRARLRFASRRIDAARAALRRVAERVDFAAVSVSVEPGASTGDGRWTPGDAFRDALSVLGTIGGALLVALAVVVPAGLLFVLAWAGRAVYLRRVREAAIGAVEKPTRR
jgi:uncharacterized protein DUF4349